MTHLAVRLADDAVVAVPAALSALSTYVMLEQEDWFEKEIVFWRAFLAPGMTVIDVGANVGVYALTAARKVGPTGQVYAYEPGSGARRLLLRGRALNRLDNLTVRAEALTDHEGEGWLAHGGASELNALGTTGSAGEAAVLTTLDAESARHHWAAPDLVKLDAEGEEERIIAGGAEIFVRASPLVMFEIRDGRSVHAGLPALLRGLGYGIYRQLPGAPILVPHDAGDIPDPFELNLFAARPDRAAALAARGLLVKETGRWTPGAATGNAAIPGLVRPGNARPAADLAEALEAYGLWRAGDRPAAERCAALSFALERLRLLCLGRASAARLSSLARIAWEAGARKTALDTLNVFIEAAMGGRLQADEPFLIPSPRFDALPPQGAVDDWWMAAAVDLHERARAFSGKFMEPSQLLPGLCSTPYASTEMLRRLALAKLVRGDRSPFPAILRRAAPDHRNAALWADGSVRKAAGR